MNPQDQQPIPTPVQRQALNQSILPVSKLIGNAWEKYKEFFKKLWPLYILGAFGVSATFVGRSNVSITNWPIPEPFTIIVIVLGVLLCLFLLLSRIALLQAITDSYRGTYKSIGSSYAQALHLFWPFIVLYVLYTTAASGGFYLFIIPGIALETYLAFSTFEFFVEGKRDISALLGSWALVKNRWWAVFWTFALIGISILLTVFVVVAVVGVIAAILFFSLPHTLLLIGLLSVVGFLICLGLVLVISPLLVLTSFELYFNLKELNKSQTQPDISIERTRKKKIIALVILGILVSFVITVWSVLNPSSQSGDQSGNYNFQTVNFGGQEYSSTTPQQPQDVQSSGMVSNDGLPTINSIYPTIAETGSSIALVGSNFVPLGTSSTTDLTFVRITSGSYSAILWSGVPSSTEDESEIDFVLPAKPCIVAVASGSVCPSNEQTTLVPGNYKVFVDVGGRGTSNEEDLNVEVYY